MPPLISIEEMYEMDSGNESDDEPMSTEMLEDILDRSKSHLSVNRIDAYNKWSDCIKQRLTEDNRKILYMKNMGKVLHKVFKAVIN